MANSPKGRFKVGDRVRVIPNPKDLEARIEVITPSGLIGLDRAVLGLCFWDPDGAIRLVRRAVRSTRRKR